MERTFRFEVGRWPARNRRSSEVIDDRRGSTTVEFAMIALPFFGVLLGILQIALVFFGQQIMETVAEKSARLLMTGAAQERGMTAAQYKQSVCAHLPPTMSCSSLYVDVQSATDFSLANAAQPRMTFDPRTGALTGTQAYSPGRAGSIVVLRIMYLWPVVFAPGLNLASNSKGDRLLVSTSVLKVEPYQ